MSPLPRQEKLREEFEFFRTATPEQIEERKREQARAYLREREKMRRANGNSVLVGLLWVVGIIVALPVAGIALAWIFSSLPQLAEVFSR
jgi:AraC-like DNA-binding protein